MKTSTANLVTNKNLPYGPFTSVHVGSRTHLTPANIIYIHADINYSIIHLTCGRKILVATTIGTLEQRLHSHHQLVRVHKSYIVNTQCLSKVWDNGLLLTNGVYCKVSRRKLKNLLAVSPFTGIL